VCSRNTPSMITINEKCMFVEKLQRKRPFGRPRCRCVENIKVNVKNRM
jgi:hypothetical protein